MATNFPVSLDALTNPSGSDTLGTTAVLHSTQHANLNDAVEALQAKVGVDSSAVTTSHDYLLRHLATAAGLTNTRITTAGDAGQLVDFAGFAIVGTPSATAPSTATNGPGTLGGVVFQQADGVTTSFTSVDFGNGSASSAGLVGYACQGTAASPGATAASDQVIITMRGHDGTGFTAGRAAITMSAPSLWTASNHETQMLFAVTANGATSRTTVLTLKTTGATYTVPVLPGSGSAGAPSYAFSTDTTTGWFRATAGAMGFSSAGSEVLRVSTAITVNRNAVGIGTSPITTVSNFNIHGADSASPGVAICAYGGSPALFARRTEGTAASPTQSVNGSSIFLINVQGYEGTTPGFATARNAYLINARESFTSSAQGYAHIWNTTAAGTTTNSEKMRLESSGSLLLGTTTDGLTAGGSLAVTQDFAHRGTKLGVFNTSPITRKTGYGTPTNNAYQSSFDASTITLPNLAAQVAQLILDLKAYGLIAA